LEKLVDLGYKSQATSLSALSAFQASSLSLRTIGALAYLVILSTLLAYGLWNDFIMRYGAGRIAPFSLMVPVFGLASASLVLGERFKLSDAIGATFILAGLLVHILGGRVDAVSRRKRKDGQ
jgi:O-acetylserine/cysteine efflux transporter